MILETKSTSKCSLIFFHKLTYKHVKILFKTFTVNDEYLFNKKLLRSNKIAKVDGGVIYVCSKRYLMKLLFRTNIDDATINFCNFVRS